MNITIDGKQMTFTEGYKNIVDLAKANGIGIPAPCYLNDRKYGCCNGCNIKVNGAIKSACVSKPNDNSIIEVNTPELIELRKTNLRIYKEAIEADIKLPCKCGDCSDDSEDCDCGCGCEDDSDGCGCGDNSNDEKCRCQ